MRWLLALLAGIAPAQAQTTPGLPRDPMQMEIPRECQPNLAGLLNPNFLNGLAGCLSSHLPAGPALPEQDLAVIPRIDNALQLARVIFGMYNKGYPIGITRVRLQASSGGPAPTAMCLVLLSGTEPGALAQATNLPEDIRAALNNAADDELHKAILRALADAVRRGACEANTRLLIAGHSLGGMEAQNIAHDLLRQGSALRVTNIVTYGSPLTAPLPASVSIRRFTTIGDPIPYTTIFTNTYRPAEQLVVDDRQGAARNQALAGAEIARQAALSPGTYVANATVGGLALGNWMLGAVTFHMAYPQTQELAQYDAFGNRIGVGVTASLLVDSIRAGTPSVHLPPTVHMYPAPRHSGR